MSEASEGDRIDPVLKLLVERRDGAILKRLGYEHDAIRAGDTMSFDAALELFGDLQTAKDMGCEIMHAHAGVILP